MDVTLCVMMPPRGSPDWSASAHALMPVLNIVCVWPMQTIPSVDAERTGYIHITGIPDGFVTLAELQATLSESVFDADRKLVKKRAWVADPNDLPPQKRNDLLADRQVTLTWVQARAVWRHSETGQLLQDIFL